MILIYRYEGNSTFCRTTVELLKHFFANSKGPVFFKVGSIFDIEQFKKNQYKNCFINEKNSGWKNGKT